MAKLKQTQLDIDSSAAIAAGMSYGYYIAAKRDTSLPIDVLIPEGLKFICAHCGKVFYRTARYNVKYCSPECQEAAKAERRRAKKSA